MTPTRLGLLFCAVSLVLLEGCQTYRPPAPTPGQLAQQQPRRPVRPARPPAARNAQEPPAAAEAPGGEAPQPENGAPAMAEPVPSMPEQTAAAAPPVPASPQRITGWRADEVRQRFGQPASQRTAGAARVWRYQGANCAVDVFFYYDTRQATFVALDQRLDGQAATPEACLATVGQPARAG